MRDKGCEMRDVGCEMRDTGCEMWDAGCGISNDPAEHWRQVFFLEQLLKNQLISTMRSYSCSIAIRSFMKVSAVGNFSFL